MARETEPESVCGADFAVRIPKEFDALPRPIVRAIRKHEHACDAFSMSTLQDLTLEERRTIREALVRARADLARAITDQLY